MTAPTLKPCGTAAAYRRHIRLRKKLLEAGDIEGARAAEPCAPCLAAHAADVARYQQSPAQPRELRPCGTEAAYQRHIANGEIPDEACLVAHALEFRRWYHRRRAAA